MVTTLNLPANDMNTVDMEDPRFSTATTLYSPANDLTDANMSDQEIPTATTPNPSANDNDIEDMHNQQIPLTPTSHTHRLYTHHHGNSNIDISWPRSTSSSSSSPIFTPNTNWDDDIDPITGLSKACTTAFSIIDSCDFAELCRFNAPLLADPSISLKQQIEMYYHGGGESEAHRRKRLGLEKMGKRASVVDKVAGALAAWRRAVVEKGMVRKAVARKRVMVKKRGGKAASV